jgi:ubiquitin carboxyl-terminal hydrolase 25/28
VNVSDEGFDLYDGLSGYFEDEVEYGGKRTKMDVSLLDLPPILQIQLQVRIWIEQDDSSPTTFSARAIQP